MRPPASLESYGKGPARLCLYWRNSYLHPRDDHPRVASVAATLAQYRMTLDECLLVGTARPELLLIYIERDGQRALHQGAVLSYRELRAKAPLGDDAWRALLRTDAAPKPLAFTASFRR